MHTSTHRFDHLGEDLAQMLRRRSAAFALWFGNCMRGLLSLLVEPAPGEAADIQWDDGEPEDKV